METTPRSDRPVRVQQKRTKGWRKPERTVGVARPSCHGNPFRIDGGTVYGPSWSELRAHPIGARLHGAEMFIYSSHASAGGAIQHAVELFRTYAEVTKREHPEEYERWIAPLRGRSLMCFCPLDQPCHADALLEIANGAAD